MAKQAEVFSCPHYKRNCHKKCETCKEFFPCRFCHDDKVFSHQFDRFSTKEMKCLFCGLVQEIGQTCSGCHQQMGSYYCSKCKLINNDPAKSIFHCDKCGICRIGKGLGIDYVHCDICGSCMSVGHFEKGKCRGELLKSNCPVCQEFLFDSTKSATILECNHAIHVECLDELSKHDFRCPLCSKAFVDISSYDRRVEEYIKQHAKEFLETNEVSIITCNECGKRGEAPYHPLYHKCPHCQTYNTTVIETVGKKGQ